MKPDISTIKKLRAQTGAGYADCRAALRDSGGNIEAAEKALEAVGLLKVKEKFGREASAGAVHAYVHAGDRIAAMVELRCETDFAARTEEFKVAAHDIAMQVAAMKHKWVTEGDIPLEALVYDEKDPVGKCLLTQPFIKDQSRLVGDMLADLSAKLGENCRIERACRWEVGEDPDEGEADQNDGPQGDLRARMKVWAMLFIAVSLFVLGVAVGGALC